MSRGIIINNPGAVETVVNLTTIRALDGDTIYTGSVYLSDISEDEIDAVKSAIEAYSGGGPDHYEEGYADGKAAIVTLQKPTLNDYQTKLNGLISPADIDTNEGQKSVIDNSYQYLKTPSEISAIESAAANEARQAIVVDHQPIAEEYQTLLPNIEDIQSQDPTDLIGQRNIFSLAADYLSEEKPVPPTPGPEIEPYYVPGWFEHQEGNWVLVKAGQKWEIQYSDNGTSWTDASYTAGDEDTWFNMDNEPFRQAKYIKRTNTSSSAGNKILAMNLDMPNYLSPAGQSTTSAYLNIWQDSSIINVKIKIDHFEIYLLLYSLQWAFYNNNQMTTCEIEQYRPEKMTASTMYGIFHSCNSLQSLDLSNWNVANVTNMSYMFSGCYSLQSLDLSNWNTGNVTDMQQMFLYCYSLQSLDLSNWNTGKVTTMSHMFSNCYSLQSLDLSNLNIGNVTDMQSVFQSCTSLQSLDLSNWNVSKATKMRTMFQYCYSLQSLDLSNWNIGNVTDVTSMFSDCRSLKDIKIKSKPKTKELQFTGWECYLSNDSLQWMADNFPDISGDSSYTNKTLSGFGSPVIQARYMWNYFYNTMTAKGYTISQY